MDMSGERISGSPQTPSSPDEGSIQGSTAAWSNAHDDVELEKSNILMLGPTGASCHCLTSFQLSARPLLSLAFVTGAIAVTVATQQCPIGPLQSHCEGPAKLRYWKPHLPSHQESKAHKPHLLLSDSTQHVP